MDYINKPVNRGKNKLYCMGIFITIDKEISFCFDICKRGKTRMLRYSFRKEMRRRRGKNSTNLISFRVAF